MLIGAIEAGGTKFVCAVSDDTLTVNNRTQISTTTPEETMKQVFEFFDQFKLDAIGIGSFGPIDVNKKSPTYGFVTKTPKLAWVNYNFLGAMEKRYPNTKMAWTTDVNVAAYGELKRGAALGAESCVYLTVGTGIGGGVVVDKKILSGYGHPEMGHILVRRHPDDQFAGFCPYHKDCLEGLAAGPAIEGRFGKKAYELPADHQAWEIEAYYLAQACVDFTLTLAPEKIIFGGGVMKQEQLFPLIRASFIKQMSGYVGTPILEDYIVHAYLEDNAGITGALLLAADTLKEN